MPVLNIRPKPKVKQQLSFLITHQALRLFNINSASVLNGLKFSNYSLERLSFGF